MTDDLLTAAELATALGVTTDKVYRWTRAGRLPHYRIADSVVRYRLAEVLEAARRLASPHPKEAA